MNKDNDNNILIFSVNNDYSTSEVIKWFRYYNLPFIRINEGDKLKILNITNDNAIFLLNETILIDLNPLGVIKLFDF